jgi:hypothetical protein
MIAIQTVVMFVLYLAPTPGGSGIAELIIAALMSTLMAEFLLPVFTVLYRFFILYLPALLGFFVVIKELKTHVRSSVLHASLDASLAAEDDHDLAASIVTPKTPRNAEIDQIQSGGMIT